MANSDKNIVITPNVNQTAVPKIVFTGGGNVPVTLSVEDAGNLVYSNVASGNFLTLGNTASTDIFSITDSYGASAFKVSTTEIVANLPITGLAGSLQLDVKGLTDAENCVFSLTLNQKLISTSLLTDSRDLEVSVDGIRYYPYASQNGFAFMPVYEMNSKSFRVRENRLIIYNAPEVGSKINAVVRKVSSAASVLRYPFSATTIGLGD
jgi:hypothetical protein